MLKPRVVSIQNLDRVTVSHRHYPARDIGMSQGSKYQQYLYHLHHDN